MMRRAVVISVLLIAFQLVLGAVLYSFMPERMAIHWNIKGEADGYGSRLVGLFLVPGLELILLPVFLILPRIDPKAHSDRLVKIYDLFIQVFLMYMFYIFCLSVAWNLGYRFDFLRMLVPAVGMLFYGVGVILEKVEMNWFLGIRTPWTLSNQQVWDETNVLGGRLFKVSGIIAFIGVFFRGWILLSFVLLPVMCSGIYITYYSYIRYRQLS